MHADGPQRGYLRCVLLFASHCCAEVVQSSCSTALSGPPPSLRPLASQRYLAATYDIVLSQPNIGAYNDVRGG